MVDAIFPALGTAHTVTDNQQRTILFFVQEREECVLIVPSDHTLVGLS